MMNGPVIEIKPLTPGIVTDNVEALIEMSKQLKGDYWTLEHYMSELNRKWEISHAVFCDGRLCAFIINSEKPESLHVHRIVVSKELHGQGIGKKLINRIAEDAKRLGKNAVTLKAENDNAQSLGFYKGLNFEIVGEQGDLVLMSLKIAS
jgi:ribosomal protein S18 acetylase RimI-like enzyme